MLCISCMTFTDGHDVIENDVYFLSMDNLTRPRLEIFQITGCGHKVVFILRSSVLDIDNQVI